MRVVERVSESDAPLADPDVRLFETGIIDSLGTVELILALSDEFGVEISPAEVDREEWATPRKIAAFVRAKCEQPPN